VWRHWEFPTKELPTSVGVAVAVAVAVPSADDSADEILRRADKALYDAKAKGRNQIQYRPS